MSGIKENGRMGKEMVKEHSLGFLIGWFRRTQYITSIGLFYKNVGIYTWRVSDCEELSGGYSQEVMGFVLQELEIDPFLS